jgi:hypothetical protein
VIGCVVDTPGIYGDLCHVNLPTIKAQLLIDAEVLAESFGSLVSLTSLLLLSSISSRAHLQIL